MNLSLWQLKRKCREHRQPHYFYWPSKGQSCDQRWPVQGPCQISQDRSFHTDMKSFVQFDSFISSRVKQVYALASTQCGMFFIVIVKNNFRTSTDSIHLQTRLNERLLCPRCLWAFNRDINCRCDTGITIWRTIPTAHRQLLKNLLVQSNYQSKEDQPTCWTRMLSLLLPLLSTTISWS